MISTQRYVNLVPSENSDKPNFIESLRELARPFADCSNIESQLPALFDLDGAVGDQLDAVGEWIGQSRYINTPLNIYFSLDIPELGMDLGLLKGAYSDSYQENSLSDSAYRLLLKAKIAANHWDGTRESAYTYLDPIFPGTLAIFDLQDMSIVVAMFGGSPDIVTKGLFIGGYLVPKITGVKMNYLISNGPLFGLDINNTLIGGLDEGELL